MNIPEPGTQEWENMANFMRNDLACDMGHSKIIAQARKNIKEAGKDFNKEFKKWKKEKQIRRLKT